MFIIIFMEVFLSITTFTAVLVKKGKYSDLIKVAEAFKVIDVTIVIEMSFDL